MYQALYRKYRPQTFDDVVGQMAVTQTLKTQLQSGKLSHAYLFTGSRGTGKTSSAKILAKAVNCENPQDGNPCNRCPSCLAIDSGSCMDVLEIDAASNNGVDNVRDLRDDAIYTPSQVKMRVYIIDEVHMLSVSAFNALLKIIEEPPETAFPVQDIYGEDATYRLSIMDLRLQRESVQVKVKAKTMRNQASLLSVLVEVQPKQYL